MLKNLAKEVSFVRIYYDEKVPVIRRGKKSASELAKLVLSYKNYRWLYEREWRTFGPLGKVSHEDSSCVDRVFLGSRMSDDDRHAIKRVLTRLSIKMIEMKISKYSISFI